MRCVSVRRTNSPIAGPEKARVPGPSTINAPNQPICSARYAPTAEPALPSCCPLATPRPCSSISTKSQRKSPPAHTPFSFSIKLDGTAPKTSSLPKTSRSCRCRRVRQSSTLKKTSGSSCGRTGCRTAFSNPSTKSSTTAATRGTRSSINPGKSCPSLAAIGQSPVNHCEGWYVSPGPGSQNRAADDAGGHRSYPRSGPFPFVGRLRKQDMIAILVRRAALTALSAFVAFPIHAQTAPKSKSDPGAESVTLERPVVFEITPTSGSLKETVQKGQQLPWRRPSSPTDP